MSYPATFDVQTPEKIANWRPLVHWILAIPHMVVVYVIGAVSSVVAVISWFAIVFTGALPEGLANVQAMLMRYEIRTVAFVGFLHEEYPPFDFTTTAAEPGGTPVSGGFTPALQDRNRLTVGLRFLWVIPALLFAFIVYVGVFFVYIAAFFAVLFTGKWPDGMRDFVVKATRLGVRVNAYALLLTDEYPPFELPEADPVSPPPAPAAQ